MFTLFSIITLFFYKSNKKNYLFLCKKYALTTIINNPPAATFHLSKIIYRSNINACLNSQVAMLRLVIPPTASFNFLISSSIF